MKKRYVDLCTFNDYDKVIAFLLDNGLTAIERNKVKMLVVVELTDEQVTRLRQVKFEAAIVVGDTPLP